MISVFSRIFTLFSASTGTPMMTASFPDTKYRFLAAPSRAGSITSSEPGSIENLIILTPLSPWDQDSEPGDVAETPPKLPQMTLAVHPSPDAFFTSEAHTVLTEFSPFFISLGRFSIICVMSLGFLFSWSARGYISQWLYLDEAQTHCTSPNPNLPSIPMLSKWSTYPTSARVTVSYPQCACMGNPGTTLPWYILYPSLFS